MLTPSYLTSVASDVVDVMSSADSDICASLASAAVRTDYSKSKTEWQKEKSKRLNAFQADVSSIISQATAESKTEIRRIMKESGQVALKYDDSIYRAVGLDPVALSKSPALQAVLLQGIDKTNELMVNLAKTTAKAANGSFVTLLDRAFLQIMSGASDQTSALRFVVNLLADEGIEKIAYPSGGYSSIESATRRSIITGVNQSVAKLQLARMDEMGCNLVETTSHSGARPTHAVWQGGIYCIVGRYGNYQNLVDATGYGSGDGLCGWNCYHNFFPYFEGLSTKAFSRDPSKDSGRSNDKDYENFQKLRYYQRRVREARKSCVVLNAAVQAAQSDEVEKAFKMDFDTASVKLKQREAVMKKFMEKIGVSPENDRIIVAGFNRSVSAKAVWGNHRLTQ